MAKKRTINELRQTKDAVYTNPGAKKIIAEEYWPSKDFIKDQEMEENRKNKNDVESTKELIINKIIKHFDDALFEMVSEEMSRRYVFQENNYLTEAGMDEFEDAWFEWYHNHHGDILHEVKKNLFE